jgi:hypothetical protein
MVFEVAEMIFWVAEMAFESAEMAFESAEMVKQHSLSICATDYAKFLTIIYYIYI